MRLENKVALVTGAGSGIGESIALGFSKEGAQVVCADIDLSKAEQTALKISEDESKSIAVQADVGIASDCEKQVNSTIKKFGQIDILVNNAGVGFHRLFLDTTLDDWNRVIGINLTGSFLTGQAAARHMVQQGRGRIINIG